MLVLNHGVGSHGAALFLKLPPKMVIFHIRVLVALLVCWVFWIQLPANMPGQVVDSVLSNWAHAIRIGDEDGVPGSWLL